MIGDHVLAAIETIQHICHQLLQLVDAIEGSIDGVIDIHVLGEDVVEVGVGARVDRPAILDRRIDNRLTIFERKVGRRVSGASHGEYHSR